MIPGSKQSDDVKTYNENEIKWIPKSGNWVCKHHPKCDGVGWLPF